MKWLESNLGILWDEVISSTSIEVIISAIAITVTTTPFISINKVIFKRLIFT